MRYCRIATDFGARYAELSEREGELWLERPMDPPPEARDAHWRPGERFEPMPFAWARLLAPVEPSKIVCIGRNYREHAAELGNDVPREPLMFLKPPSALLDPEAAIEIPSLSRRVDFEGELGVVIGRRARHLQAGEDIRPYIRGYTVVNDVTARDLQKSDGQWSRAKGFDTFCPAGPLVTDEIDPARGLSLQTRLNGDLKQDGSTQDLIFPIAELLRYISAAMTLLPGDLIPTGTPAGVGPMQTGDVVEVAVEGIGVLRNTVR